MANQLRACLTGLLSNRTADNLAVRVGRGDEILFEEYHSRVRSIDAYTRFDMASVTKILATTPLCLIALDRGLLTLDTKVSAFFPDGSEPGEMTLFHLLTHTMGIGYKPLYQMDFQDGAVGEFILSIPRDVPLGSEVLYSCPGFIVLGKILEKVFEKPLDVLFDELVCKPLGMTRTEFCPKDRTNMVNANGTDFLLGVVNDYNCRRLGGVSGNAGVFSNMNDLTKYAKMLLSHGDPIIGKDVFEAARENHTEHLSEARGLGFCYVDRRYGQTGDLFPVGSFGHCGHTGQSLFADPVSKVYVIILSDATKTVGEKYGTERYSEVMDMRTAIHNAIKLDLDQNMEL